MRDRAAQLTSGISPDTPSEEAQGNLARFLKLPSPAQAHGIGFTAERSLMNPPIPKLLAA